jgi:hypothetical protein
MLVLTMKGLRERFELLVLTSECDGIASERDGAEGKEMGWAVAGTGKVMPKTVVMARARMILRLNMVFLQ